MKIGILKESKDNEFRAAVVPNVVKDIITHGHEVYIQSGLGNGIDISDEEYQTAGANVVHSTNELINNSILIIKVKEPTEEECNLLTKKHILFTYLHLAALPIQYELLKKAGCTATAYETVTNQEGHTPLLAPMSEVAGRLSVVLAAPLLLKHQQSKGILLSGVPGVKKGHVVIIGAGVVGTNALLSAVGLGAKVTIIDNNIEKLRQLDFQFGSKINTLYSGEQNIRASLKTADLVIGAVLIPGAKAPKLVTQDMLAEMEKGTVMVDVAIDQGGCFETSRPTSFSHPTYEVNGIIHSAIANLPGGVSKTSSYALNNATAKYIIALANKGYKQAFLDNPYFMSGLNLCEGKTTHRAIADSFGSEFTDPVNMLR